MRCYFAFFVASGFCSILYELIWVRLAMAEFGVTAAMISIVLSMFMAGLAGGSWLTGTLLLRYRDGIRISPLYLYAATELLIACSVLVVPQQFIYGRKLFEAITLPSSQAYYWGSATWVAVTLIPWCVAMGATIPLGMFAIRRTFAQESSRSFSYLYTANVFGAVMGVLLPLGLVELIGFRGTLRVGAILNCLIKRSTAYESPSKEIALDSFASRENVPDTGHYMLVLLFTAGLASMGMEVVWIRLYTAYLGTVVYAFAGVLAVYLTATFIGSQLYRHTSWKMIERSRLVWIVLGAVALFPLWAVSRYSRQLMITLFPL